MHNSSKPIVVVGSSNLDLVVSSPRIPLLGETLLGDQFFSVPGGKGANQAVAAARLGGDVTFVSKLGSDASGDQLYQNFKACGVRLDCIFRTSETPTGVAFIIIDNEGNNVIVVAPGANQRLSREDVQRAEQKIAGAGMVVAQLEIPLDTVFYTAELAEKYHVPFILDPAPAAELPTELLRRAAVIKPNETEAEILTGIRVEDEQSAVRAAEKLLACGVGAVLLTMGSKGFLMATAQGNELIAGIKVNAVDSTAAGDAFTGALAVGLSGGQDLREAALFANKVAAISTTAKGAQSSLPSREEVDAFPC